MADKLAKMRNRHQDKQGQSMRFVKKHWFAILMVLWVGLMAWPTK